MLLDHHAAQTIGDLECTFIVSLILFCFVLPILVFIIPTFVCAVLIKGDVLVVLVRVLVVVLDLPPWAVDEEGIVCVCVCVCVGGG